MNELLNNRVQVQSLVDAITARLEGAIISGELAPGTKLSEQGLAQSLGVSRGPLREAIRRLEGRKLVRRTPNLGAWVSELNTKDLIDLLVAREALEGMACRLAAENMSGDEIRALGALLSEHAKHRTFKAGAGYYQEAEDFDFHFRIVKASQNGQLVAMLCEDLYHLLRVYRYKSSTRTGRAAQSLKEHQAIVEALARRDPDLSEQRMRAHIRSARAHVEAEWSAQSRNSKPVGRTAVSAARTRSLR